MLEVSDGVLHLTNLTIFFLLEPERIICLHDGYGLTFTATVPTLVVGERVLDLLDFPQLQSSRLEFFLQGFLELLATITAHLVGQAVYAKAATDGTLTFQLVDGNKRASFKFADLSSRDHATLAEVIAAIKSDSTDAQAMAAVYMESLGRVPQAEKYYAKSNDNSRRKLEALFGN